MNPNTRRPPTFFPPTENEWYNAAYFSPDKGDPGVAGYRVFATQSSVFEPGQNDLTAVGAFADSGSHYGTLNQNGTVYQWNDLAGRAGLLRGLSHAGRGAGASEPIPHDRRLRRPR